MRNRVRKTNIGSFSEDSMRMAVDLVLKDGLTVRAAAERTNLKYQTIFRYVKKIKVNPEAVMRLTPNYKSRLVFTVEQETLLKDYIVRCCLMCYGKSTRDLRELAYEMAKINKIKMPQNWHLEKKAGKDWMSGFFKRFPDLSIRCPEGCSLSRLTSFNKSNVDLFFNNLNVIYDRTDAFSDGSRVWNLDETGTSTVQRPCKVIAQKGVKQVNQATSGERGITVTTVCFINATGNALPPVLVFPRVNFKSHMLIGAPSGSLGLANPSGWVTSELFPEVMKHFVKFTSASMSNPQLLIFDNHVSHLSIEALNIAKENGVTVLTLPPHSSNKLQPLDVAVFYPFKAFYYEAIRSWLISHPGRPFSIYDVSACVGIAHQRAQTPTNIINGFKKTGIYPFDRNVFTDIDFMGSQVTDRPGPCPPIREDPLDESLVPLLDLEAQSAATIPIQDLADHPSTSTLITPEQFRGYPKAGPRKKNSTKKLKVKSVIATDSPFKNLLALKKSKRNVATPKKRKSEKTVKKLFTESVEVREEVILESNDHGVLTEIHEKQLEAKSLRKGEYVVVEFGDKRKFHFVGRVIRSADKDGDLEISFLRKSNKIPGCFFYPPIEDISCVCRNDIKIFLPPPIARTGTKRLTSFLSFDFDFSNLDIR